MEDEEPPAGAVEAEPTRCIDRRPSSWLLVVLLCVAISLGTYVALSAAGVGDRTALITAGVILAVNAILLCVLAWVRRETSPGTRNLLERMRPKITEDV